MQTPFILINNMAFQNSDNMFFNFQYYILHIIIFFFIITNLSFHEYVCLIKSAFSFGFAIFKFMYFSYIFSDSIWKQCLQIN